MIQRSRFVKTALAATLVLAAMAPTALLAQQPVILKFAALSAPGSIPVIHIWEPWVKKVNDAAKGEFQLEIVSPPIATATNVWERTINGVVDIGSVVLGPSGQPFTKSNITNLPGLMSDSAAASAAFYRLYAKGLIADEYKDVRLMSLSAGPNLGISATKPIRSLEDIKGLKIRSIGKVSGDVLTGLGASPIALPFGEVYQALSRGVISGGVVSYFSIMSFKSGEVAKEHTFDFSMGMGPLAMVMNKQSYEKLSPKGKAIIDEFSGESASRAQGAAWDKLDAAMKAELFTNKEQHLNQLSPAEMARWQAAAEPVRAAWIKDTPNGAMLLQTLKTEYAAALAGK